MSELILSRHFATANHWTFKIKPINKLIQKYVLDPHKWVDPFAGEMSPAFYTNDINPERKAKYHLDAIDFCKEIKSKGPFDGVLFDPPYSYRQVSEHYKAVGKKATWKDTSYNFYTRIMDELNDQLPAGSHAISFGWNTTGFTIKRGWEKKEIMIVSHGAHHNDTLITVEVKK